MPNLEKNASYATREIQIMLDDSRGTNGWVTCIIAGRWVQAKLFDVGSKHGINRGRISKLYISKEAMRDRSSDFTKQMAYAYDRGLEKNELCDEDIDVVITALEKLPAV